MFARRGYTEPKVEEKASVAHLLRKDREPRRSRAPTICSWVRLQMLQPRRPRPEASKALLSHREETCWPGSETSSSAFALASPRSQAPPRGSFPAFRLKRAGYGPTVYHNVPLEQELQRADDSFGAAIDLLGTVMRDIRVGKGLEIEAVESVVEDLVESIIRHPGALQLVSRMREADESSYTHALQVAVLLASFGRELGFSRDQLTYLGQVGMLLDVGNCGSMSAS